MAKYIKRSQLEREVEKLKEENQQKDFLIEQNNRLLNQQRKDIGKLKEVIVNQSINLFK